MGPHEVVNGANGSVTWCAGVPFCPQCTPGTAVGIGAQRVGSLTPQGQPTIRLGGDALPPWGYRIVGVGYEI